VRREKAVHSIDFPEQMLTTGRDDKLAPAIAAVAEEDILYRGALFYGDAPTLKGLTGKFTLWS
jgi:hypothetical protein